ncbi:hypothetical protein Ccrd_025135 [Cynara cardunculus var. scolymus]|uniref:AAA+ ATPase domain-containing protein n=1 Tax=Cynara cardunculus var. scolymus TaxID=59895 RepID=A0A103XBC4_CYNCS|nr:hypothetical protein Ccrd_025135 [Cynara cardunculus var. scolymus]
MTCTGDIPESRRRILAIGTSLEKKFLCTFSKNPHMNNSVIIPLSVHNTSVQGYGVTTELLRPLYALQQQENWTGVLRSSLFFLKRKGGKNTARVRRMAPLLQSSQPWVEKYRPRRVKDVAHQDEVVRVLTNTLETTNCPHMLFYGPPGTGKTTTALAIAHQLYGPELYKSRVLELNASDDRGINVVRTKIKNFAAVAVGSGQQGGYPCPPYKIIILDEADSMTEDAQAIVSSCSISISLEIPSTLNALRRTMETYSKVTRFFFVCNYISRIIEPLASRCAKFRFKPLSEDIMSTRILHISKMEGLNLDSEALSTLSSISQGDLRRAITFLQGAARLFGSSISSKDLISVSGVIPHEVVEALLAACKSGSFDSANKEINNAIAEGYPVSQMLSQLFDMVVESIDFSDEQKARICRKLGESDKCLVDGADEYLQLLDACSSMMKAFCNMPEGFSNDI